ncbi:hypothetical protein NDA14_001863 [Ustilago hordei]|uniref:DUF1746 domain-containing protein n=1 Tax=Ustilago hordei TaxID=120017 RepID=I2FMY9_USTHO|nr:uncharacterized protein UHO2_05359 [Ustilago hordei]KAJ1599431.1 hypothetical protein NDA14_001863 [Ustilago hordei]UTT90743.1 hypothetical protein NDA17_002528 [Ustilago hordei]CCF48282.1 uncharacterized protein UHOR_06650 [Ustilago hordei]SYW86735.1 uncharacterized protein UHO2_05359 [Ustilago hordei]
MYFERKELIQSLDLLCFVLFVYTWLLDNRTFLLVVKAALQVQFCNAVQMHPTWSLPFLVVFLCSLNLIFALVHLLTPASQTNSQDAMLIDFVGQVTLPGRVQMFFIDALVCFVQLLMTVIAFETSKDELKPDGEPSVLDDLTSFLEQDDLGHGWDVRDEEATLFGLDEEEERKSQHTSLTHHIAVVRLRPIFDQIRSRQLLPTQSADESDGAQEASTQSPLQPASTVADGTRPDTSRIRRFSQPPRTALPDSSRQGEERVTEGLGEISADNSWPPMWLIIGRNMIGGEPSLPSFRRMQGLTSITDSIMGRFGRNLSQAPNGTQ